MNRSIFLAKLMNERLLFSTLQTELNKNIRCDKEAELASASKSIKCQSLQLYISVDDVKKGSVIGDLKVTTRLELQLHAIIAN